MANADALETGYAPMHDSGSGAYSYGQSSMPSLHRGGSSLAVNNPAAPVSAGPVPKKKKKPRGACQLFWSRFWDTLAVCVAKIFCGGFLWQGAALVSAAIGNSVRRDNSFGTFVLTGLGDGTGVFIGATMWVLLSYPCVAKPPNLLAAVRVSLFLGCASFCSGFMWQLFVNISTDQGFYGCAAITGVVCGSCFFAGLRLGRLVYGRCLGWESVQGSSFLKDAQLSLSVAGASFCFVCTDDYFHGNPLKFLRVYTGARTKTNHPDHDETATLLAMFNAGLSTFIGFFIVQMAQNAVMFRLDGHSWLDGDSSDDDEDEKDTHELRPEPWYDSSR